MLLLAIQLSIEEEASESKCVSTHPGGIIDLHLCQQLPVDAEVAETASVVVDDAVALAGHRDEPRTAVVIRALQGPQEVPRDGVHQTWAL